ncbi:YesL family protein [uncultured Metabacillus sp.]|uniref:YesL family protein n=1 Tax=uncultured Metabacillus sp. TaxID=2860135 RepID=UPI0026126463|nr:YesL family protein [uncultured Metabacillus sp.]
MNGNQLVTKLDNMLHWVIRLVMLNILWFIFSILGLFVAGIFPATAAVLGIARKWLMGDKVKIWTTFKDIYLHEFKAANLMGWTLSVMGIILYFNYRVIVSNNSEMIFIVPFAFYFIIFFYTILVIWSFPLLVHYKATCLQHFKNALIIGLSKLQYTIVSGAIVLCLVYGSLSYPGVIPFFTVSAIGICCMWLPLQIFNQLDQRQQVTAKTERTTHLSAEIN